MEQTPQEDIAQLQHLRAQLEAIIASEEAAFMATVENFQARIDKLQAQLDDLKHRETRAIRALAAAQPPYRPPLSHSAAAFVPQVPVPQHIQAPPLAYQAAAPTASFPAAQEQPFIDNSQVLSPIDHLPMLFPQPLPPQPLPKESAAPIAALGESAKDDISSALHVETPTSAKDVQAADPQVPLENLQQQAPQSTSSSPQQQKTAVSPSETTKGTEKAKKGGKSGSKKDRKSTSTGFEAILNGQYIENQSSTRNGTSGTGFDSDDAKEVAFKEEEFPSLQSVAPAAAAASGNPWAQNGALVSKLQQPGAAPSRPVVASAATDIEEMEERAGLRVPEDGSSDLQRRSAVRRKTFEHREIDLKKRREVNVVEGLELHLNVLSKSEQAVTVEAIESWVEAGRAGELRGRTFSAPKKWMAGKGRVTMQFGCCYNYASDDQGRDPGIIPEEVVEPMPPLLQALSRRLVRWGILPASKEPDSAIINIYEEGDCIPPHIDHFDFIRPFCSLSFLSEQKIMFAQRLVPLGPGEFSAQGCKAIEIPLSPGSCIVLKGSGGDNAMHCVPPVSARRMSITLRKIGPKHAPLVAKEVTKVARAEQGGSEKLLGFWER